MGIRYIGVICGLGTDKIALITSLFWRNRHWWWWIHLKMSTVRNQLRHISVLLWTLRTPPQALLPSNICLLLNKPYSSMDSITQDAPIMAVWDMQKYQPSSPALALHRHPSIKATRSLTDGTDGSGWMLLLRRVSLHLANPKKSFVGFHFPGRKNNPFSVVQFVLEMRWRNLVYITWQCRLFTTHTYTHTYTHIYIYIYL